MPLDVNATYRKCPEDRIPQRLRNMNFKTENVRRALNPEFSDNRCAVN